MKDEDLLREARDRVEYGRQFDADDRAISEDDNCFAYAEDKDLAFWMDRLTKGLEANPDKDYADRDRDLVASIGAEMKRRLAAEAKPSRSASSTMPTDDRTPFDGDDFPT